jgi:TolB-like protein
MKKYGGVVIPIFLLMAGVLGSCATIDVYKPISIAEIERAEMLGPVETSFPENSGVATGSRWEEAYIRLLREARERYPGYDLDVRNIRIYATAPGQQSRSLRATGEVIAIGSGQTGERKAATGIEDAVNRAGDELIGGLPGNATVAVLSVSSYNYDIATFVIDELEYRLVAARQFKVVDRKTLDTIRSEQNFQMSGEVDDDSAVSIGKLLGANIVITGAITGSGATQRLTLKALDVKTAQIVTMAREQF